MIFLSLPEPGPFGWGVFAENVTKQLSAMTNVINVQQPDNDYPLNVRHPALHAIQGVNLLPIRPHIVSTAKNVGACFIEDNLLVGRYALNAERYFDHVVAGSEWGRTILKEAGVKTPLSAIVQGASEPFFELHPRIPDGKFIVFSGGKSEHRKGQDIVIKAMKVLMDRHDDVWLSYAWHNIWKTPGYSVIVNELAGSIDRRRVMGPGLSAISHAETPALYFNSDIGVFPNRCEAGTNLVMMEYMASGRPVIATYAIGHIDVLEPSCQLNLRAHKPVVNKNAAGEPTGIWVEPDLDEAIANLEWAYQHRDALPAIGEANRTRMRRFTWQRCAQEFLSVLTKT